ncbi:MAG: AAA family ATPase [Myxococcales bacterium]|nr:MAG: AAA family ATPase [Myxococcales bacterium]
MKVEADEFFREVTLRISSSLDVDEALASLYDYLKPIFPLDGLILIYREPDGNLYSVSNAGEKKPPVDIERYQPFLMIDPGMMESIIQSFHDKDLAFDDVLIYNQPGPPIIREIIFDQYPQLREVPSTLLLSLKIKGEEVGWFGLKKAGENIYTREHASLLQTVKEPISIAMSNARRYRELMRLKDNFADDNRALQQELEHLSGNQVIGGEFGLRQVMELVRQAAPLNSPILLLGETGTGKEVIANAIHLASPRRDRPMVRVQCGAIPDTLLDSELFGHEKGAFTGAINAKRGRFERAQGGTIFFDEIGELTLDAQVKLLRVLQEHEIERLGGVKTIKVDVRIIAATHRDLEKKVREGTFREDLWYRLNVFPIQIPPLRDRKEDLFDLTTHFIAQKSREMGLLDIPTLPQGAFRQLESYDWPGNVRELQNVVERALITCKNGTLTFQNLVKPENGSNRGLAVSAFAEAKTLHQATADAIRLALKTSGGQVEGEGGAAALLNINPSTLRAKMRKLGIPFGRKSGVLERNG